VGEVSYKGHRYPAEIIAHCGWLYHRFPLSFPRGRGAHAGPRRDSQTIRQWCAKFGPGYAAGPRAANPDPATKWHLNEVFLTSTGRRHYLWRAVDQDGNVLDILDQPSPTPRPPSGSSVSC
jgi:putative transposase